MANRLSGKVAIVTGAGRGIGRAEAMALASEGAAVVVNDVGGSAAGEGSDMGPAQEVVAEIEKAGGRAVANTADITNFEAAAGIVKQALDELGGLDILVNNAGILRDRMVFNMTEEEWDAVLAVHLKGAFNLVKHAAVVFRQQRSGRIINTSSESGLGNAGQANYSAAKEGLIGLTRTVARELGRYNVTCNAIRPRAATRMTMSPEMEEARKRRVERGEVSEQDSQRQQDAMRAAMDPAAIASLVTYLASEDAQNVNGRDFLIWGKELGRYSLPAIEEKTSAPSDIWSIDDMFDIFPKTVGKGLTNDFAPKE